MRQAPSMYVHSAGGDATHMPSPPQKRQWADRQFTAWSYRVAGESVARVQATVNPIGWLRRSSSLLVLLIAMLLIAMLLIAPLVDCGFLEDDAHADTSIALAVDADHHAVHGQDHQVLADIDDHCGPHVAHCIMKSLPSAGAPPTLSLHLLGLMMIAAVVAFPAALSVAGGGVRGPPGNHAPAGYGRDVLTRFCIARR